MDNHRRSLLFPASGVAVSFWGAGKALIALYLGVFSQTYPVVTADGQRLVIEQDASKLLTQLSVLAHELALTEAISCTCSLGFFGLTIWLMLRHQSKK